MNISSNVSFTKFVYWCHNKVFKTKLMFAIYSLGIKGSPCIAKKSEKITQIFLNLYICDTRNIILFFPLNYLVFSEKMS